MGDQRSNASERMAGSCYFPIHAKTSSINIAAELKMNMLNTIYNSGEIKWASIHEYTLCDQNRLFALKTTRIIHGLDEKVTLIYVQNYVNQVRIEI